HSGGGGGGAPVRARAAPRAAGEARRGRGAASRGVLDGRREREAAGGLRDLGSRQGAPVIRRAAWLAVVVCALAGVAISIAGTADALERLPSVLHLHSDLSTGDFALEQLTAMAEKQGRSEERGV